MTDKIKFTLDGRAVEAEAGETIWQVAQKNGTRIPHLCWHPAPGYRADGNCRACMVEVEGERVLAASCQRKAAAGMKVKTASERAMKSREMVFELLLADQPERETSHDQALSVARWLSQAQTPADVAEAIRSELQREVEAGEPTGMRPQIVDGELNLTHRYAIVVARL